MSKPLAAILAAYLLLALGYLLKLVLSHGLCLGQIFDHLILTDQRLCLTNLRLMILHLFVGTQTMEGFKIRIHCFIHGFS